MRQHILATALAAAVTALAYGQNLNPTVEVTNAYQGGASSIAKPAQQMAVPDSVTRFNLDFDYSVFEKPYQVLSPRRRRLHPASGAGPRLDAAPEGEVPDERVRHASVLFRTVS